MLGARALSSSDFPPGPASSSQNDAAVVADPAAAPRPPGPPEADEEQEHAEARAFLGGSQPSSAPVGSEMSQSGAPLVAPPAPVPIPLSDEIRARIARNRAIARERRVARATAERERRLLAVAPWSRDPTSGVGLFDLAMP